ncbi:MAG: hypothetical protein ABJC13_09690 [Acidobacteriota bacterium]
MSSKTGTKSGTDSPRERAEAHSALIRRQPARSVGRGSLRERLLARRSA